MFSLSGCTLDNSGENLRLLNARTISNYFQKPLSGLIFTFGLGILFAVIFLVFGEVIYISLGASKEVLEEVLKYSNVLFAGSFTIWVANGMAGVVRATGNMFIASLFLGIGSLVQIILGAIFDHTAWVLQDHHFPTYMHKSNALKLRIYGHISIIKKLYALEIGVHDKF